MVEAIYRFLRKGLDFCPRTEPIPIAPRCRSCGVAAAVPLVPQRPDRPATVLLLCKDCQAAAVSRFRCLRCNRPINESLSVRAGDVQPQKLYRNFEKTEDFRLEMGELDPDRIQFCPFCRFPTLIKCPSADCGLIIPTPFVPLKDGHLICPNPHCLSLVRFCPICGSIDHDESNCPWPPQLKCLGQERGQ